MTTRTLPFPAPLDCAAVDERLADWLDDPAPDPAVARHLATCARCRELVDDLRAVSAAAGDLPPLDPPAHLWNGIAARLGAQEAVDRTVVPLPAPTAEPRVRHVRRRDLPAPWRLAAAAVALVAVTAGVTYRLARPTAPVEVAAAAVTPSASAPAAPQLAAGAASGDTVNTPAPDDGAVRVADGGLRSGRAEAASASRGLEARRAAGSRGLRAAGDPTFVAVANPDAGVPGAAEYDREITALRAAVRERRGELDSATVAVLVRNLRVIDQAIAQSRAALARDPHSPFLGDQLTRALGQKVDLLRTAALLPRT